MDSIPPEYARRIAALERKVGDIYQALGRAEPTFEGDELSPEAQLLFQQGRKIEAIKLHREQTGLGLAEAKAAVERYEAIGPA